MADVKSIRGNSIPQGGVAATTEAGQGQPLMPDTFTLVKLSEQLMECSEQNCIQLNQVQLTPGQQKQFNINNVGLGESLEMFISGTIDVKNDAAEAVDVAVAPDFPYNLVPSIITQFNGQTVIDSLSAYELLGVMAKRNKGVLLGLAASAGAIGDSQTKARVPKELAYIKAGNADTTLGAGDGLTGVNKVTVAANKTGQVEFGFYLRLPYTMRDDILLGLIPMQNNSVYASITLTLASVLGGTAASPLYVAAGVPATLSIPTTDIKVDPTYNFWSIPQPNSPALYAYLCSHSYMLLSQPSNPLSKTGAEALQFGMPNNYYLLSLLFALRDKDGVLQNMYTAIDNPYLSYNGTARVDRRGIKTRFARQTLHYEGVPSPLGQLLWDATDVAYLANGLNSTKWLNMYLANNPTFVMDVAAGLGLNASYSVLREQLVPANVQIV